MKCKVALIGNGYWGNILKRYINQFFRLEYVADSKFDKDIIWNDKSVKAVCGLQVTSHYLSAPIIYATINPASLFQRGGVGEVRLALTKFVKAVEDLI